MSPFIIPLDKDTLLIAPPVFVSVFVTFFGLWLCVDVMTVKLINKESLSSRLPLLQNEINQNSTSHKAAELAGISLQTWLTNHFIHWQSHLLLLSRYKKPEADEGEMGSRNPFSSGYTMLNTAPNDSQESQSEGLFSKYRRRTRSSSNPVEGKRFAFIADEA